MRFPVHGPPILSARTADDRHRADRDGGRAVAKRSETEAALDATAQPFRPNVFVDITAHLERKLRILQVFEGEIGEFPFPRSPDAVRALAGMRGAAAGYAAAEAFQLLRERV